MNELNNIKYGFGSYGHFPTIISGLTLEYLDTELCCI